MVTWADIAAEIVQVPHVLALQGAFKSNCTLHKSQISPVMQKCCA